MHLELEAFLRGLGRKQNHGCGVMVNVLDSRLSGVSLNPGGTLVAFLARTLYSHSVSLQPGV